MTPTPLRPTIALLLPLVLACSDDPVQVAPDAASFSTFTDDLEGWVPSNLGLAPGSSFSVVAEDGAARFDIDAADPGGEGVLARAYTLTPGATYVVIVEFLLESSDLQGEVQPWRLVVGTSVEGGAFSFNDELDTGITSPTGVQTIPVQGDLQVTAGPPEGAGDTTSEVRLAIGIRPTTADQRTYRLDDVAVRFIRTDDLGG